MEKRQTPRKYVVVRREIDDAMVALLYDGGIPAITKLMDSSIDNGGMHESWKT